MPIKFKIFYSSEQMILEMNNTGILQATFTQKTYTVIK